MANLRNSELEFPRVYHDEKGQAVYLPLFSKDGYILVSSDIKEFAFFSFRLPISAIVAAFLIAAGKALIGVAAGVTILVVWEIFMRKKFLSKLPVVHNFKKPSLKEQRKKQKQLADQRGMKAITSILISICGFALGVASYINVNEQNYTGFTKYGNYAFVVGGAAIGVYYLYDAIKKLSKKG